MNTSSQLSRLVQDFFRCHLIERRNVSPHTISAYRDTLRMFLAFVAEHRTPSPGAAMTVDDFGREVVLAFLEQLERERHNCVSTRNARLAALHAFLRFVAEEDPTSLHVAQRALVIPYKRTPVRAIVCLERSEIEHLLRSITRTDRAGRRDLALIMFLYNTGARAQEALDLHLPHLRLMAPAQVRIMGKGRKERLCPLWTDTVHLLKDMLRDRAGDSSQDVPLFVNARSGALTRFGLEHIIRLRVAAAARTLPSLAVKHVTPHSFRHTTALHLLQSGVELNVVRSWLGHASIETTHRYVEIDMQMKREALEACQPVKPSGRRPRWLEPDLLSWLESL